MQPYSGFSVYAVCQFMKFFGMVRIMVHHILQKGKTFFRRHCLRLCLGRCISVRMCADRCVFMGMKMVVHKNLPPGIRKVFEITRKN